jgi:hypothetical protein
MRAAGGSRKDKMQTTRVVGIGMMLAGIMAFTFAVVGMTSAGATSATPKHHTVSCDKTNEPGSTMGQVAEAINQGCHTTTTVKPPCTCSTTTTNYVTTTTCASSTTTSSSTTSSTGPTTTSTTQVMGSTTLATTTTAPHGFVADTTTTVDTPVTEGIATTTAGKKTVVVEGSTATLPPASIATAPTSGVLPFTGGSPYPLAGFGLVLLGAGAGLSRRKRNLAD